MPPPFVLPESRSDWAGSHNLKLMNARMKLLVADEGGLWGKDFQRPGWYIFIRDIHAASKYILEKRLRVDTARSFCT